MAKAPQYPTWQRKMENFMRQTKLSKKNIYRVYINEEKSDFNTDNDKKLIIEIINVSESKIKKLSRAYTFKDDIWCMHYQPANPHHYGKLIYEGVTKAEKIINESIVDAEKKMLNPNIWNGDTLKDDVKQIIIKLTNSIADKAGLVIKAIYFTGSNLGYYYNTYTDLDVHFTVSDELSYEESKDKVNKVIEESYKDTYFIQKHPLEFFLMDDAQENKSALGGIYDVLNDKWMVKAEKIDLSDEEFNQTSHIAMHYARTFDMIGGELKRDIIEYRLQDDLEDELNVEGDKPEAIRTLKWQEIVANIDAIVLQFNALKQMRKDSFEEGFSQKENTLVDIQSTKDRSLSTYNIIFKILDRYGYIPMAKEFKYDIQKRMIEDQDLENNRDQYISEISTLLQLEGYDNEQTKE